MLDDSSISTTDMYLLLNYGNYSMDLFSKVSFYNSSTYLNDGREVFNFNYKYQHFVVLNLLQTSMQM